VRAVNLKRCAYTLVDVKSPLDFKRWNPQTGKMPVLDVDGERTYDSTLVLRALDTRFPEPPLVDADPNVAARQRFLEDWSDEALYWYGMALRWADVNADATVAQVVGSIPLPSVVRPLIGMIFRRQVTAQARAQGLARLPMDVVLAELARRFDELLVWLADRPFFFADRPNVADLAIRTDAHDAERADAASGRAHPSPSGAPRALRPGRCRDARRKLRVSRRLASLTAERSTEHLNGRYSRRAATRPTRVAITTAR
jgi:glutathione S-transferase